MSSIPNLINYIRSLAQRHKEVGGFITGEEYELNERNHNYPLVHLHLPLQTEVEEKGINVTLTISVFTNIVTDDNANKVVVTEQMLQKDVNQLDYTDIAAQDELVANAYRICAEIVHRIVYEAANDIAVLNGYPYTLFVRETPSIVTAANVLNDTVYEARATLQVVIEDTYKCSALTAFTRNVPPIAI